MFKATNKYGLQIPIQFTSDYVNFMEYRFDQLHSVLKLGEK